MRLASFFALALVAGCSCGPAVGARCYFDSNCVPGLVCIDNACTATTDATLPDAGRDASSPDAALFDAGPITGQGCSADLRDVLDTVGHVLRTCPPDQGCSMGTCIAACAAAAAAHGSLGCDYVAMTPPTYPPALPPCHAVFIANSWDQPVHVTLTRGGTSYDATMFGRIADNVTMPSAWAPIPSTGIPVDAVGVLFLSSDPNAVMPETGTPLTCPITPAINSATTIAATGNGDAWHVATDAPVAAYDIIPFGGAPSFFPSASLLLPTTAIRNTYVVIATPPGTATPPGPQWLAVIGATDNTHVMMRPSVDLPGGGTLPGITAGTTGTVTLNAGRVAQWQLAASATTDPSGTLITADQPIAVVTGNRFFRLQPTPAPGGEGTHQQILPLDALGSRYVAPPYTTRRMDLAPELIPYRIVGAVDGTTLTFSPPVAGAPTTLMRGQVADISTTSAFVVSSQDAMHPFALAQIMPTANLVGGSRPGAHNSMYGPMLGDEEFVILFPPDQFLSRYVFFTDPTYWTTNLALTRVPDAAGMFHDVTVDCLGVVGGWTPADTAHSYEVTTVDLVRASAGVGSCANGHHVASSAAPFGVMVWGTDAYASYAYPAGGNARQLAMIPPPI
jgi:hypothetical protein